MSNNIKINLKNFYSKELQEILLSRLNNALQQIENDAKVKCPVDDGILRASIKHDTESDNDEIKGIVGTNVDYAPFVHEGTGLYAVEGKGRKEIPWKYQTPKGEWFTTQGQRPNPFLQQAIDENLNNILNYFKGAF